MKIRNRLKQVVVYTIAAISAGATFAQEGDLFVEEILVTARKQTESLQDIPLSLTAIDSKEIELQAIENTEDVINLTPGLTYTKGIGGQDVRPDIRGITPLSGRANLALLVDGVDISSDAIIGTGAGQLVSLGLYDIERIEVVRGPQSALFGRNAFGGAINYITKKPSVDFEGSISGEVASYDSYKTKLGLSGPITEKVLYRINMVHSEKGGQYTDELNGAEYGGETSDSISLALQFLPNDDLEILTRFDWSKQDTDLQAKGTIQSNGCIEAVQDSKRTITQQIDFDDVPEGNRITCPNSGDSRQPVGTIGDTDDIWLTASDDEFEGTDNDVFQWTTLINYYFLDDYTFTSNTSLTKADGVNDYDLDHLPNATVGPTAAPIDIDGFNTESAFGFADTPENALNYHTDEVSERTVIFQDFRLSFDAAEDVRWLAGFEFYREKFEQKSYQRANNAVERNDRGDFTQDVSFIDPLGFGPDSIADTADDCDNDGNPGGLPNFPGVFELADKTCEATVTYSSALPIEKDRTTTSWGIYGSYDWLFHEEWEISLSARYQQEKIEGKLEDVLATLVVPAKPVPANGPGFLDAEDFLSFEEDFETFNPRIVLTHYLNDSVMLFASVAKGTKPGGVNGDIDVNPEFFTYDQEELVAYEFGWKTSWFDDRVIVNGAIFLNDNTEKHANNRDFTSKSGTPRSYIDNIGKTQSSGLELQVAAVIAAGWTANLNYAFTETEIKEYINLTGAGVESPGVLDDLGATTRQELADAKRAYALLDPDSDQSGNELPFTPKHNLTLNTTYEWALSDNYDAFVRVDYRMQSERWVSTNNLVRLDNYSIWDLKFGIQDEQMEVTFFVNNVDNDDTITNAVTFVNFASGFSNMLVAYPAEKRTAGVRVNYDFY